ncbi:MAG: peptidase M50 [archaeon]
MRTSKKEIIDLLKAWVAISIAFAILLRQGTAMQQILYSFIISAFTVGTAFIFHEMAHKVLAQRYGLFAEFRSFDTMLILAIAMSFFGFVLAAPGAVMIRGHVTRERNGKLSAMGPLTNLALALIFFGIKLTNPAGILSEIANYGVIINSWIAVFNLIPVWNFDGAKVWQWNKAAYLGMAVLGVAFLLLL